MRIFCLMQVESSFAGSASTDRSRMALFFSDDCTFFYIKSSRLIVAVTFHALVQSRLTCVDLTYLPRAMTLKIFFLFFSCQVVQDCCSSLRTQVLRILRPVSAFAQVVRIFTYVYGSYALGNLCAQNTSFARKLIITYVYDFCAQSDLCIRVRLCA